MVRILVLKRLYSLSDEQMEYQLLDGMSYKRFCGLANATNIPDRTSRTGSAKPARRGCLMGLQRSCSRKASSREAVIDATLVPAPRQHIRRSEKELIEQGALPADWKPAKRRQKPEGHRRDLDQEARQEPFRLQAVAQRRQEVQDGTSKNLVSKN